MTAEIKYLRAQIAFGGAELVVARAYIGCLERRLAGGATDPSLCPYDNKPCIASKGTEDEHFRCGTCQCGRKA